MYVEMPCIIYKCSLKTGNGIFNTGIFSLKIGIENTRNGIFNTGIFSLKTGIEKTGNGIFNSGIFSRKTGIGSCLVRFYKGKTRSGIANV